MQSFSESQSPLENDKNSNKQPKTEPRYSLFVIGLYAVISALYFVFLYGFRESAIKFFIFFEDSTSILAIYFSKLSDLLFHPNFTEIAIIVAFILGVSYVILSIESRGHMIIQGEDANAKNVQTSILFLTIFNAFFLAPFCLFLWLVVNRPIEAVFNIVLFGVSCGFVLLFTEFANMMQNYDRLILFCKALKPKQLILPTDGRNGLIILIMNKAKYRDATILLMIVSVFFAYVWNLNFLTLVYTELILFFWIYILLTLTFPGGPVKGPLNIFLTKGQIFNRVFIIEESSKGYIVTLHDDNKIKKIIANSISYIEGSDD